MRRRQLLASLAVGGGAALSGCQDVLPSEDTPTETRGRTPTESASPPSTETSTGTGTRATETEEPAFDRVIDMVADQGVDDTGGRPIDAALRSVAADDTLLEFPPGTYLVTEPLFLQEATNFGIRGTGERRGDVRFVHPRGYSDILLDVRDGRNCLLENFTADQTDDRVTNSGIVVRQQDGLLVRDVEVAGFTPTESDNPDQKGSIDLVPQVMAPDGVGEVVRFVTRGGGEVGVYPNSYPGLYSGRHNRGTLRLVDCIVEDCGGAGVYTSRTFGPVQITGGRFRNNEVAQVRISGEGSFLRNAEVVIDTERSPNSRGNYETVRGLWWESGDRGKSGGVVEDCTFVVRSAPIRRGLLEVDGTAGAITVRRTQFRTNRDRFHAVHASPPGSSPMGGPPDRPWGVTLEDVRVTGSASGRNAVLIAGRPGSTLRGVEIEQSGTDRDGVDVRGSPGFSVAGSSIDVDRYPLRLPVAGLAPDAECALELADDTELRSDASSANSAERLDLEFEGGVACLPTVDGDSGALVVIGSCDQGYVGAVVDGDGDPDGEPDGTVTGSPCR